MTTIFPKDLPRTLQANSLKSIVDSPTFETKITFFKVPLSLNSIVLSSIPVRLDPLQPTTHKITHCRVNIFSLFLFETFRVVGLPLPEPFGIVLGKWSHQRQNHLYIFTNKIFVFYCVLQPEIISCKSRLQFFADSFEFGLQDLPPIVFGLLCLQIVFFSYFFECKSYFWASHRNWIQNILGLLFCRRNFLCLTDSVASLFKIGVIPNVKKLYYAFQQFL